MSPVEQRNIIESHADQDVETHNLPASQTERYWYYTNHSIDEKQIADVDHAMLEQRDINDYTPRPVRRNIRKLFKSEYDDESPEYAHVNRLFAEMQSDYIVASKRTIIDYILIVCLFTKEYL